MIEVLRTVNPVDISYAQALLKDAGIVSHVFDVNFSVLDGSVSIIPRRVMVSDEFAALAREILAGADIDPYEGAG